MGKVENCKVCKRFLDNSNDWLSADCGGNCRGCMNVIEEPREWMYWPCTACKTDCVIRCWQAVHLTVHGQFPNVCVEVPNNISNIIQNLPSNPKYKKEYLYSLLQDHYGVWNEGGMTEKQLDEYEADRKVRSDAFISRVMNTIKVHAERPKEAPYENRWKKEFAWKRSK